MPFISHLLKTSSISSAGLANAIYSTLVQSDASLGSSLLAGFVAVKGDRLHVKYACRPDSGFLAIEVLDTDAVHLWEVSIAPLPDNRVVVSSRSHWHADAHSGLTVRHKPDDLFARMWRQVVEPHIHQEQFKSHHEPHFMALVGAMAGDSGLNAIKDDSATISNLQDELAYWQGLAKSQSKILKDKPTKLVYQAVTADIVEVEPEAQRVWTFKEMDQWAALNADKIVILPRAIAAAKRSHYENPQFVFECLELLANQYREVKAGVMDRNEFKKKADAMGLAYGGSVDPSVAGELGDQYFVRWRGRRRFLDQHISKGSSRDPRFAMRIYFTWDEDDLRPVVGWLPSHLDTSRS